MKYLKTFNESASLDSVIEKVMKICHEYTQKWGDCYKVNSTAAFWLNKNINEWRYRIYQVEAHLDCEIYDDDIVGYTDEPLHVVVVDSFTGGIEKYKDMGFYPDDNSKWYDFSNVFTGDRECEIEYLVYTDELGGEIDEKLLELLKLL